MKLINAKTGYLIFALISFVVSVLGFAGLLEGKSPEAPESIHLGLLFLFGGIFLIYCYLRARKG